MHAERPRLRNRRTLVDEILDELRDEVDVEAPARERVDYLVHLSAHSAPEDVVEVRLEPRAWLRHHREEVPAREQYNDVREPPRLRACSGAEGEEGKAMPQRWVLTSCSK